MPQAVIDQIRRHLAQLLARAAFHAVGLQLRALQEEARAARARQARPRHGADAAAAPEAAGSGLRAHAAHARGAGRAREAGDGAAARDGDAAGGGGAAAGGGAGGAEGGVSAGEGDAGRGRGKGMGERDGDGREGRGMGKENLPRLFVRFAFVLLRSSWRLGRGWLGSVARGRVPEALVEDFSGAGAAGVEVVLRGVVVGVCGAGVDRVGGGGGGGGREGEGEGREEEKEEGWGVHRALQLHC